MMVVSQILIMKVDERLYGVLHRAHLDQSHLVVFPEGESRAGQSWLELVSAEGPAAVRVSLTPGSSLSAEPQQKLHL